MNNYKGEGGRGGGIKNQFQFSTPKFIFGIQTWFDFRNEKDL